MLQNNNQSPELSILNRHPSIIQGPGLLHDLVQASSDKPAVDFLENGTKRRKFSYATLHALSDTLASSVSNILARLESASPIVPVYLPQCPELYVVLLAILKAGKAFCPLNLDTPVERLKFILQDISADLIITTSPYSEGIHAVTGIRVMLADRELAEHNRNPTLQAPRVNSNDLAYVLYTSGSTGLPKAVSVSHRAATQSLLAHDRHIPDFDRFLQFAAPTFDVSIFEIFFPWFRGRTLVGCTRAEMLDDLPRSIMVLEVDAAELTPTVVSNLLHGRASVPGLKLLLTIGEMLTQSVIDEYGGDESKESILWAMYGPTEAAIHCTLQPQFSRSLSIGTIGFPIDTVSIFIAAQTAEGATPSNIDIVPRGEIGELLVGGYQVAEEYLNRPELTAASFIDHQEYGRLYRTGDLARLCSDGHLECLGRVLAGQVKLRGQRVELGEIEKILMRVDGCRTATVIIVEEALIAFCATGHRRISRSDLLSTCQQWLPSFMVPADVVFVSSMPQLPSGKIDKRALELRYVQTSQCNSMPVLALDDHVAHVVSSIVRQYTKHDLSLNSSLLSAGLDSLRSIRVASALRHEGYNLGAMDILRAATLGDVITACRQSQARHGYDESKENMATFLGEQDISLLQRWSTDLACTLPCTPLQEAMLAETAARSQAYCNWVEVELSVSRSYDQIRAALLLLIEANEILRTGFHSTSQRPGAFVQLVWKKFPTSQIREVATFSRVYSLGSDESLLRPLTIQIRTGSGAPRLLFQIHHALYDGWSFDLLLHDLNKLLHEEAPARRPQYRDVVRYFTRKQRVDEDQRAKKYWAELLLDHISTCLPNYSGKMVQSSGLRTICGQSSVNIDLLFQRADELAISPQVFFQAATAYILSLYTGSTDIVLGNVTSGRMIPVTGVEDVIGPCIASLPFRLDFQQHSRVQDVLHKTQSLNRNSLQHCTLPLREIARVAKVQPGVRLFDVLFVWQQSLSTASHPSPAAKIVDSADDLEYKITLEFEPRKDHVMCRATFDPSIIPENQIKYLSRQIDEVVQLFLKNPTSGVTEISRCFTNDSCSISNPNPRQPPIRNGPAYAVEKWALDSPDKEAVAFGHVVNGVMETKDTVTYGALNTRANQLAGVLSQHGVGHDQLVGVIMEKSIDLYVSILAILKLGCGYLPLVPETPLDRISMVLIDAQVTVCISESTISSVLRQKLSANILDFDLIDLSSYSGQNLSTSYDGSHLAYAIFTSGSTGTPKGVLVTQDNLMSNISYLSSIYPSSADSRMLQACSQAFDVSVFEIFFAWHVGMCLCTARKDDLFRDLEAAINRLHVTHLSLTPTVAALVEPDNVPSVEFLVTAGEALTERVRRKWVGRGLYQGYGPSETTNICTVKTSVTPTDLINNIGHAFDNTSAFVLDPDSDTVLPRGAVGELCFGGAQVFRGYLNRPELNAAKILEHPAFGRIYRSGDMGILLPNDSILFTGRSDDQVKIRGQRVELGEITSTVLDNERVQDCATLLELRPNKTKALVNFWVPVGCDGNSVHLLEPNEFRSTIMELFQSLLRRLPSYMVPSHLIPISRIPMTAQAKIDKRFLQNMFAGLSEESLLSTSEPHDDTCESGVSSGWESDVAQILADVLELPSSDVLRRSSFFNLGLDSVSAIRFCNALRRENLGDFAVSMVLKNPTIASLASARETIPLPKPPCKAITVDPTDVLNRDQMLRIRSLYKDKGLHVKKVLPCTPLQIAMISSGQSSTGSTYCNMMVFDINGDICRLQACWALMFRRHEIFRTSFASTDDPTHAFVQVVLEHQDIQWQQQDLQGDIQKYTNDILSNLLKTNRPPVYLALSKQDASTKLIFCCHHALYDGSAIATMLQEIQDHYHNCELPPSIAFDTYLQHMLSQDLVKSNQYWTATFKNFEPTFFPRLTGRSINHRGDSATVTRCLQLSLRKVHSACRSSSISLLSIMQAAWAKVLHFYTNEGDICFGNIVSGRNLPGDNLDRLVAPCFNTLPVRITFDFHKEDNQSLARLAHTINIETLDFQLTSLRQIQNLAFSEGGHLFDTLLILQQSNKPLDGSIWTLEQDMGDMDLPVVCEVFQDQVQDILKLTLHYHASALSEVDAKIVAETFDNSLLSLIKSPQAAANDTVGFPSHLRAECNMDFEAFTAKPQLLHSGFESNALSQPDHIALDYLHTDGSRTIWSFQDISERADDIAHALINSGIGVEDIVPIHMPKSPHFYASILGVLKAGAGFAPVHPDLPDARRQFMLAELKAKVVLCSEYSKLRKGLTEAQTMYVESIKPCVRGSHSLPVPMGSNLAYCLFTSGSTGVPKAVSMEHKSPVQTISSSRSLIPWISSSRLLQYAEITFDMCYYDCFLAWTYGFTLCAAEQSTMLNDLPKVINALDVDLLDLTPSVATSLKRSELPKVRWLYCIGEAMTSDVVKEWDGSCVNSYGPTEAAFCTTMYPIAQGRSTSIIGKPFPSTSFAVFSSHGKRPLPLLSIGELYIGGAQLARGYLGKAELTKERFVHECGQRFYKSGDIVRMLSDGNFEFIGRADDQVKIRGLRVELGEINHVLQNSHSDIAAVITQILKKSASSKEQLVAFLVTDQPVDNGRRVDIQKKLKKAVKDHLPSYMVPQFFLFIETIPRSMAGKIDKRALLKFFLESDEVNNVSNGAGGQFSTHRWTALENQVRNIFSRLSKVSTEEILPTTSIYQLGLDSISAVQIAAALRRQGHNLNAADVMKYTTCADIAIHLSAATATETNLVVQFDFNSFDHIYRAQVLGAYNVKHEDVAVIRPCTPLQNGMLSQFLMKEGAAYMNYLSLQLDSDSDLDKMKEAWITAMGRHAILRTGFAHTKDTRHPFVMIHYTPNAVDIPWTVASDRLSTELGEVWLQGVQGRALRKLHMPPWEIRIVQVGMQTYLDIAIFHGLFDAQSLQSIFNDVTATYQGQHCQAPSPLDPVISSVLGSSQSTERGEAFWTQLGKKASPCRFPNLAPLRYDPRPSLVCSKQSTKSLSDLEAGCRKENITIQAAGIASWLSLLSAYTGEPSVTCGVVLSGRNLEETENAVFPCINTVPFACAMSQDRKEALHAVMILNAVIQQHQFTPLTDIQRMMGFSNEPLFDTIFAYQKLTNQVDKNSVWSVVAEKATTEYPVSIELEPRQGHLEYRLTFLPHIIPEEQARLILDQLDYLLEGFIFPEASPQVDLSFHPTLYSITPAKQPYLPSEANLLHELVEITASKYPKRIAFEFAYAIGVNGYSSESWTYPELDAEGNRIAHLLLVHGARPGDLIGVCFEKCPEASFAMLGVLKAGCAFVAVDPGAPAARQAFIVKDSQARLILSMAKQSTGLQENIDVPILNLDEIVLRSLPKSKPTLCRKIDPQDRSYCLYTSGTTGTPKGCELTHENAVQALLAFQRLFAGHWNPQSRWLQFASFHFDVSVLEQYWSWSVGLCVVSAPRDLIFEDLAKSISTLGITHIDLTPSLAQILHPDDVPSLCKGVFITGGESLKQEILDVWGPKGVIYNGYGPTEATIGVTMYTRVPANGKPSNIGQQFDNVGSFVLEIGSDIPVLRGGVGELCVSGTLVGKGYLNRADLTAERFPFLDRFAERVYRTGDLVRVLHDGSFDFLGRADDQVKLRGQRLEIGEINSVIRQSTTDISDVATLVLKHPKQQTEQLVAFIVPGRRLSGQAEVLLSDESKMKKAKEACHDKLPPYMVPTYFIPLTNIPLNINNKADARNLKEIYESLSSSDIQNFSASSNTSNETWSDDDRKLQHVLAQTLDVDKESIGINTSFFELGMDSISVIRVSRAIKQGGLSKATASDVMRFPTIRRLAKVLETKESASDNRGSILAARQAITAAQHRHRRTVAQALSIDPSAIEALAPCTPLQQGMIARYLNSKQGLYFNSFKVKLNDNVDEGRLRAAWENVYASTQILRTVFANTEDGYVQAVLCNVDLPWALNTTAKNESIANCLDRQRQIWLQLNRTEIRRPFELVSVTTPRQKLLVVHIFHGLYDGNSVGLIFKAVWDAYNERQLDSDTPSFHSALAHGPLRTIDGAKEFWRDHLTNTTFKPFPILTAQPSETPIFVTRHLDTLTGFEFTRRKLNVTAQAIAQACWLYVLHTFTKRMVTVGLVVSGRSVDLEGMGRTIGPIFNTIPHKHQFQSGETWISTIKSVHEFNTAAYPYQHTSLRDVMKWCKRSPNQPLFETLFVYQVDQDEEEWTKNDTWEIEDGDAAADYPLAIEIEQKSNDSFKLTLTAQGHISDEKASNELLDHFEEALRQVLDDPSVILRLPTQANGVVQNGVSKENLILNGTNGLKDFEWTENATRIRDEIAALSGVEVENIHEATSIFELGLDSIDAIKLSSKLKKRGISLPVSGIMRGLNIATMVQDVSSGKSQNEQHARSLFDLRKQQLVGYAQRRDINMQAVDEVLPVTPLQEAMIAEMIASEYTRYYNFDVMKVQSSTDVDKLRNAWTRVVEGSPILRTTFLEVDDPDLQDSFAQIVHRRPHEFWSQINLQTEPDFHDIIERLRIDTIKSALTHPPFNILHVEVPGQSYLILSIAHALYDGWSLGLLHFDVNQAHQGQYAPRSSYESPLAEIVSTSSSDAASFWQDYLYDAKKTSFPRRIESSSNGTEHVHRLQQGSHVPLAEIVSFAKKSNISLQTLGQTVFVMVLASSTHSLDVTFGSVLSGRDSDQRSQLMFPTMNTVAIRTILHGTRLNMLHYVQDNFTSIKQWQHFPLRKAISLSGLGGSLFESLFIYQKSMDNGQEETDKLYTSIEGHSDVEYPVCVEMEVVKEQLVWRCAVKEEVFSEAGAKLLLEQMDEVLKNVLERPEAEVIEITSRSTSICGLPSFEEMADTVRLTNGAPLENGEHHVHQPQSSTAQKIRETLAAVSKISEDEITTDMTIFHIGLDSISAIKVSSLLRKQGIALNVGEMLRAGTITNMAKMVDTRALPKTDVNDNYESIVTEALGELDHRSILHSAGLNDANVVEVLPVTAGQLYMLSMWLNSKGSNFYPEFTYEARGSITFEVLQRSWQALVKANAILRTHFAPTNDDRIPYLQIIMKESETSISNTTGYSEDEVHEKFQQIASGQPWAHLFVSHASNGWNLRLSIHHALYDGVSLPILMHQFQGLCNGVAAPSSHQTLKKLVTSSNTVSAVKDRRNFWIDYLKSLDQQLLSQPVLLPKARVEIFRPALFQTSALEVVAREHGISIQSLVLATYAKLFATMTVNPNCQDIVLGVYLANRSLPLEGIETAAIPTVNLLPLCVKTPLSRYVLEIAASIQSDLRDISNTSNISTSLFEINEWTGIKVDTFINFLTLPDTEEVMNSDEDADNITIIPTAQWQNPVSRVSPAEDRSSEVSSEMRNEHVNSTYFHAIDVEATIRNGVLDMGIFAPTNMLSLEQGEKLAEDLRKELASIY
ncbi:hypothetical protein BKA66DRAFT_428480 [Pyrenochaeta sp. MPI-SDFR-AT-0127]|nr:hypothetical protein BKA66DRAFT_428480 [Pyrenochaeta sp. MPI-SDFR-AT-0127]